jgi:N-acetylmuramoyl-L-alanine amidase
MLRATIVLFISLSMLLTASSFHEGTSFPKPPKIRTVIVDPGHGGLYPGTHGLISTEKDVTLEVSLKLGEAIQKEFPDVKVVFTRTSDACSGNAGNLSDDLHNRAKIANQAKGDLFISIHCNATPQPAGGYYAKKVIGYKKKMVYVGKGKKKKKKMVNAPIYQSYWVKNMRIGTETYIWKSAKQGNKGDAINEREEGGDGEGEQSLRDSTDSVEQVFDLSSPEARMRAQLYEKKYFDNSMLFASMVEDGFKKAGRESYGVKQRDVGIRVLQATGMPSVLVEIGFLTNKEEEEYLNSDEGQKEVVDNIVDALKQYKEEIEK